ncbi:hypothetical protein PG996_005392 [Apiospora saccharicola]|uniref:Uncharacterized protein n=1 Tax=Apiospora saccharicola TaxID=335842 RepID=A0ABR1VLD2_9PEZI
MHSSGQAESDQSAPRGTRITAHPTTAVERKSEREDLSEASQRRFLSEPSTSSNRTIMMADQTSDEADAIKKSRKKAKKNLDRILAKLN